MELEAYSLLRTMEHYRPYVEDLTGNERSRIPILIEDMGNTANGYADPVGNMICLFRHSPTDVSLSFFEDWWQEVGVHEYIHILHITKEGGLPKGLRILFGNILHPNYYSPMWVIEGITVYGESAHNVNSGRLNGGEYPAINRSLAKFNKLPRAKKANWYSLDTPHAHFYNFGGGFFDYLAETYGKDSFARLFDKNGRRLFAYLSPVFPALGLDYSARKIYGKSLAALWDEWVDYEEWVAQDYRLPQTFHSNNGWYKYNLSKNGDSLNYTTFEAVKTSAGTSFPVYRLMNYDPEQMKSSLLHEQGTGYPAGYQIVGDTLFYSRQENKAGFGNNFDMGVGTETEIWQKSLSSGKKKMLTSGQIRAFCVLDSNRIIIARDLDQQKGSELLVIKDGAEPEQLLSSEAVIHGIFHSMGRTFLNAKSYWKNSSIYELDQQTLALVPLIDTPRREVITSVDGNKLYFTANYGEFLQSYIYELNTGKSFRIDGSDFMSDAVLDTSGKNCYYLSLSGEGYELGSHRTLLYPLQEMTFRSKAAPFSQLKEVPPEDYIPGIRISKGNYWSNLRHLVVPRQFRFPIFYATKDSASAGYLMSGADVVGHFPSWEAGIIYDFYLKKVKLDLSLENRLFKPIYQSTYYTSYDKEKLVSDQYAFLIKRLNYGLDTLKPGLTFTTKTDYQRKIWSPYLDLGFNYYGIQNFNRFRMNLESTSFTSSDRRREGYESLHNFCILMPWASDLKLKLHLAYDPQADKDEIFSALRGYEDGIETNKGFKAQTTFSKNLLEIRDGFWNPNIYIEDLSGGLFFDLAQPIDDNDVVANYSGGLELKADLNMFFFLSTQMGASLAYTHAHEFVPGFVFFSEF